MKSDPKKHRKRFAAAGILLLVMAGCCGPAEKQAIEFLITEETLFPTESEAQEASIVLDIAAMENRENELVFNVSIDDFIDSYNSFYKNDHNRNYLTPSAEWQCRTYDTAIHSNHETKIFRFTEDEKVHLLPTITVYVPTNGEYIQEITVDFDGHGYTEAGFELYEQLCFYTLKVFFPALAEEQIIALYQEANRAGDLNVFPNEEGYAGGCVPSVLYYKDGIGVYPYYAIGEWAHLCIIPATESVINGFKDKGVEIHEIA